MIYLRHDEDNTRSTHASLQALRAHLAATDGVRPAAVPEVQEQVLEQAARAQDPAGTAGGDPW
jgi:hypothetical protein